MKKGCISSECPLVLFNIVHANPDEQYWIMSAPLRCVWQVLGQRHPSGWCIRIRRTGGGGREVAAEQFQVKKHRQRKTFSALNIFKSWHHLRIQGFHYQHYFPKSILCKVFRELLLTCIKWAHLPHNLSRADLCVKSRQWHLQIASAFYIFVLSDSLRNSFTLYLSNLESSLVV